MLTKSRDLVAAERRLSEDDLANPQLLLERHSSEQAMRFARARASEAERQLSNIIDAARTSRDPAVHRRLARWQYEVSAAGRAQLSASQEADRIYKEIVNE